VCDYVDGETIRKKDIVLWLSSSRNHIPVAEDAPSVPTGDGPLGFTLQ
jgi:Cu2+-containing amine oxidase